MGRLASPDVFPPAPASDPVIGIMAANQAALTTLMLQTAARVRPTNPHLAYVELGSGVPCIAQAASPWYAYWANELRRLPQTRSDLWQMAATLQALFEADKLQPGARVAVEGPAHPLEAYLSDLGLEVTTDADAAALASGGYDALLSVRAARPNWEDWLAGRRALQAALRPGGLAIHIAPVRLVLQPPPQAPRLADDDLRALDRAGEEALHGGDEILPCRRNDSDDPLDGYVSILSGGGETPGESWLADFKVFRDGEIETPFLLAIRRGRS